MQFDPQQYLVIRVPFQMNWRPNFLEFNNSNEAVLVSYLSVDQRSQARQHGSRGVRLIFKKLEENGNLWPYTIVIRDRQHLIQVIEHYGYCTQATLDAINEFYNQLAMAILAGD
jgi:hypothetical protein